MGSNMLIENVYAPLPFGFHLCFCILATIVYTISFIRKKQKRHFYLMLAIDFTLLTHLGDNVYSILVIVIAEIVLILMAFVDYIKFKTEQKRKADVQAIMEKAQSEEMPQDQEADTADTEEIPENE